MTKKTDELPVTRAEFEALKRDVENLHLWCVDAQNELALLACVPEIRAERARQRAEQHRAAEMTMVNARDYRALDQYPDTGTLLARIGALAVDLLVEAPAEFRAKYLHHLPPHFRGRVRVGAGEHVTHWVWLGLAPGKSWIPSRTEIATADAHRLRDVGLGDLCDFKQPGLVYFDPPSLKGGIRNKYTQEQYDALVAAWPELQARIASGAVVVEHNDRESDEREQIEAWYAPRDTIGYTETFAGYAQGAGRFAE